MPRERGGADASGLREILRRKREILLVR
uniref:Uncharacterized protein n=1 Tax=Rhizophora mucronata TaxID=61149 RepID=A0A2P2J6I6_RHIMU